MAARDLLLEIGTEELPPKALKSLSAALEQGLRAGLQAEQLEFAGVRRYATPRRLAIVITSLAEQQPDKTINRLGPALKAAYDEQGKPTPAALGFAKSCGVKVEELQTGDQGGVEKLAYTALEPGRPTAELIPSVVLNALAQLPIPKRMRWGSSRDEFVRPVHWAILLFGSDIISMDLLGVKTGSTTRGHRFHQNNDIPVECPADYEEILEEKGGVIPDFDKRRELVRMLITEEGAKAGAKTVIDEDLLDEVTSLVEYPVALTGRFDEDFLSVPAEALILTMKSHQKCFYLVDRNGSLLPLFVTVSNLISQDPAQVIQGNERVIRPRLADARFFYETDKQVSLESRREQLKAIVFQEQLGTVYAKSERVAALAASIGEQIGADPGNCIRAAELGKCDLLTSMVGEFADLQGLMGSYYARHDGEAEEVAAALNEQYMPRFSGDGLPESATGCALAIADKLDSIVGMFGIGQPPTGSRDPFALRRSSIGILRILVEKEFDLDLYQCIEAAVGNYRDIALQSNTANDVFEFMLERFRAWYLDEGIPASVFQSVFALKPRRPFDFHRRIQAVYSFNQLTEAAALAAANKRVSNLLDKQGALDKLTVKKSLLSEAAEKELHDAVKSKELEVAPMFDKGNYTEGLLALVSLRSEVDDFFDQVLVMCEDEALKNNRLALLFELRELFLHTADISYLHTAQ